MVGLVARAAAAGVTSPRVVNGKRTRRNDTCTPQPPQAVLPPRYDRAMTTTRRLSPLDQFLARSQHALETVFGRPAAGRPNPAGDEADVELDESERRHAAGLMRINHVGEICAQALYVGQAAVARDPE